MTVALGAIALALVIEAVRMQTWQAMIRADPTG